MWIIKSKAVKGKIIKKIRDVKNQNEKAKIKITHSAKETRIIIMDNNNNNKNGSEVPIKTIYENFLGW